MIAAVETSRDGDEATWEVRRDGRAIGTATKPHTNIFSKLDLPPAPDDNRRVLAVLVC